MKKTFTLIIASVLASLCHATPPSYQPVVVEGRTWWYGSTNYYGIDTKDYGLRIGKQIVMDGKQWNEVRVVKSVNHNSNGVYDNPQDEDILVAYVREENSRMYSYVLTDHNFDHVVWYGGQERNVENLVYDFSDPGNSFTFGKECPALDFKIDCIEDINNCGNTFKQWTASVLPDSEAAVFTDRFKYAEKVGVTSPFIQAMVFYYPCWQPTSSGGDRVSFLRYVTEGDDNTVIYKAEGGLRLWEYSAVDDITADNTAAGPAEYFDVHGRRIDIDRAAAGTVVICRRGCAVTKSVVR